MALRVVLALAIVLSVLLLVAGILFAGQTGDLLGGAAGGFALFVTAIGLLALTSIAVGALIRLRVPGNPIGTLMIVGALGLQGVFVTWPLMAAAQVGTPVSGLLAVAAVYANLALVPSLFLLFPTVGLVFPDGRLPGPRWRLPFGLVAAVVAIGELMVAVSPWAISSDMPVANPLALAGLPPELAAIGGGVSAAGLFAAFALAVAGIGARFRQANQIVRAQIKWLVAALSLMAVVFPLSFATQVGPSDLLDLLSVLVGCLTPIAIGIAILRYRLYEIDRLVSRTVSWAIVTGGLLAVFAALVIGLQSVLDGVTQGDTLAVALSTLVAAASFQPLRRRVQHAVDRRFDRARVDGEHLAEDFAHRLSAEVDLDRLASDLRTTAGQAVRPASATIWLASRGPR